MAQAHLRELREIQPRGPYRLGGFCNGGLIAYEMALLLQAEGEIVERLTLVAANALNVRTRWLREVIRVAGMVLRIPPRRQALIYELAIGYAHRVRDLVRDPFRSAWRTPAGMIRAAAELQRIRRERLASDGIGEGRFDRLYERAVSEYFPGRFNSELVVVVGLSSPVEGTEDPTLGWGAVASHVRMERIPGGHHVIEEDPEAFARLLLERELGPSP